MLVEKAHQPGSGQTNVKTPWPSALTCCVAPKAEMGCGVGCLSCFLALGWALSSCGGALGSSGWATLGLIAGSRRATSMSAPGMGVPSKRACPEKAMPEHRPKGRLKGEISKLMLAGLSQPSADP